jgi:hypothetical protein
MICFKDLSLICKVGVVGGVIYFVLFAAGFIAGFLGVVA